MFPIHHFGDIPLISNSNEGRVLTAARTALSARCLAAFSARFPRFRGSPLVRIPALVGCLAALACDLSLLGGVHSGESSARAGGTEA